MHHPRNPTTENGVPIDIPIVVGSNPDRVCGIRLPRLSPLGHMPHGLLEPTLSNPKKATIVSCTFHNQQIRNAKLERFLRYSDGYFLCVILFTLVSCG